MYKVKYLDEDNQINENKYNSESNLQEVYDDYSRENN